MSVSIECPECHRWFYLPDKPITHDSSVLVRDTQTERLRADCPIVTGKPEHTWIKVIDNRLPS